MCEDAYALYCLLLSAEFYFITSVNFFKTLHSMPRSSISISSVRLAKNFNYGARIFIIIQQLAIRTIQCA